MVATVLTACGIETLMFLVPHVEILLRMLQQYLPLAVLKPGANFFSDCFFLSVATVLTACGIETYKQFIKYYDVLRLQQYLPLAVLKLGKKLLCLTNYVT